MGFDYKNYSYSPVILSFFPLPVSSELQLDAHIDNSDSTESECVEIVDCNQFSVLWKQHWESIGVVRS